MKATLLLVTLMLGCANKPTPGAAAPAPAASAEATAPSNAPSNETNAKGSAEGKPFVAKGAVVMAPSDGKHRVIVSPGNETCEASAITAPGAHSFSFDVDLSKAGKLTLTDDDIAQVWASTAKGGKEIDTLTGTVEVVTPAKEAGSKAVLRVALKGAKGSVLEGTINATVCGD